MLLFFAVGMYSLDWKATAVNIALLGPWSGSAVPTLWFVEILLFFQLSYAVRLSFEPLRRRPWSTPMLLSAIVAVGATVAWALGFAPDPRLVIYLPAFAGGAVCGEVLGATDDRTARIRGLLVGSVATVSATALVSVVPIWLGLPADGLMASILTTFAVCAVVATPPKTSLFSERPDHAVARFVLLIAYGSYMAYLGHRLVFEYAARLAEPLGEAWVTFAVLASIPLVLAGGVWLQRMYDARARDATSRVR